MISQDGVLTAIWSDLNNDTALRSLLGDSGRIVKGPKRPDGLTNPCVTVHMPVRNWTRWGMAISAPAQAQPRPSGN